MNIKLVSFARGGNFSFTHVCLFFFSLMAAFEVSYSDSCEISSWEESREKD